MAPDQSDLISDTIIHKQNPYYFRQAGWLVICYGSISNEVGRREVPGACIENDRDCTELNLLAN
jgi:hypothetical protein